MSRADETRARILASTRTLLESGESATMGRIAAQAGVTRQLLYLHFDGRGDLLLELSRAIDAEVRRPADQEAVDRADEGRTALRLAVELQGRIKPRLEGIVLAMQRLAHEDTDVAGALAEREDARRSRAVALARRLADEGSLRPAWSFQDAGALIWSATSQDAWRGLVVHGDWTTEHWVAQTVQLLDGALCVDPG